MYLIINLSEIYRRLLFQHSKSYLCCSLLVYYLLILLYIKLIFYTLRLLITVLIDKLMAKMERI